VIENTPLFKKYVQHVLKWEGRTSSDQDDTAAACAPYNGAVHTNKGVTYCTFRTYAASLGIQPVTHARFLSLTNEDVSKFIALFVRNARASEMPTPIALSVTEAAWLSGPKRAVMHLQEALNKLGARLTVDGVAGPQTIAATLKANLQDLYEQYWIERQAYLDYLIALPPPAIYWKYKKGWYNRINDFLRNFSPGSSGLWLLLILFGLVVISR